MGEQLRDRVKERYAGAARSVLEGAGLSSCCGSASERGLDSEALGVDWTGGGYSAEELNGLPEAAGAASLGCGNPTALATLSPGEVVLDLGSGGGIDVLLSARRVSPGGKAYGLDMTDEMLELAEKNKAEAGVENVEFLRGHIEDIPLPEDHVDVVISNCVINLSADKPRVISEAYRVLKPAGRFAVSDMVFLGDKDKHRLVARYVVEAGEVGFEVFLLLEIDVKCDKVDEGQPQILCGGIVNVGNEASGILAFGGVVESLQVTLDAARTVPPHYGRRDFTAYNVAEDGRVVGAGTHLCACPILYRSGASSVIQEGDVLFPRQAYHDVEAMPAQRPGASAAARCRCEPRSGRWPPFGRSPARRRLVRGSDCRPYRGETFHR
jgi:SAM-dependent methyltransferase